MLIAKMEKTLNNLILVKNLVKIWLFNKGVYAEIKANAEIKKIMAVMGKNWLNFDDRNELMCDNFFIIFIIAPKFPKCFLEISYIIKIKLTISPKHLGNFGQ